LKIIERKLAKCYIEYEGDEGNKCEFTDQRLSIIKKGKRYEFPIESLRSITFHQRKLLMLVILSGILTPLVLVGFFKELFNPFLALLGIVGGVFIFYLGWIGQTTFTINKVGEYSDFIIKNITNPLLEFAEFVNQYISNEPEAHRSIFLKINNSITSDKELIELFQDESGNKELYSYWQLHDLLHKSEEDLKKYDFVALNPLKMGVEVKFVRLDGFDRLRPTVKGKISIKALLKRYTHDSAIKLFIS